MEKTLRRVVDGKESRAETYRYWHSRPDSEIFEEIARMSKEAYREYYRTRGTVHGEGSARSFTRIQRTIR